MSLLFIWLFGVYLVVNANEYNLVGIFEENENPKNKEAFQLAIESTNLKNEFTLKPLLIADLVENEPFATIKSTCDLLNDGAIGIFGPKSFSNINAVQSISDEKELPHILTRWIYNSLGPGTALNFFPDATLLTKAYWEIIEEWEWKTFTVLYEDDESLLRLSDLILMAKEQGIVVSVDQLDKYNTGNYRDTLKRVWKTNQRYLVIDCKINILLEVLIQCQQHGLMTSEYSYFITNLDAHTKDLSPFQYSQTNITGIRLLNTDSLYVQQVSTKVFAENATSMDGVQIASLLETETALIYDAVHMFAENLKQLALPDAVPSLNCYESKSWEIGYSLVNLLKTSSYKGLTGNIEFNNEGHRSAFGLQVYELREGGMITVATYNSTKGLNITRQSEAPEVYDQDSMRNKTFVVIISLTEPYGMLRETSENLVGNDRYEGFSIDLIHELSLLEGFNYTFIVQHDKKNGNIVNGRWTGMIGAVIDGVKSLSFPSFAI